MKRSLKDAAKKGQKDVATVLAKEIIHSRKAISKIYAAKAQLQSVTYQMKNQEGELNAAQPSLSKNWLVYHIAEL